MLSQEKKLINYTHKEIHSHHYKIKNKKSYCLVLIIATLTLEKLIMVVYVYGYKRSHFLHTKASSSATFGEMPIQIQWNQAPHLSHEIHLNAFGWPH